MSVMNLPLPPIARPIRFASLVAAGSAAGLALAAAARPAPPHAPASIPRAQLLAVSALSATSAWAVGDLDTRGPAGLRTLAVRWNGSSWVQVPAPAPPAPPAWKA